MRRTEIDLARTSALLAMIPYHLAYDLHAWYGIGPDPAAGRLRLIAYGISGAFLLISGISFTLSGGAWRKAARRFGVIGAAAALVSAVTYAVAPETYVRFGILHLIALSALLLPAFRGLKGWMIAAGVGWIALSLLRHGVHAGSSLLLPLGLPPPGFRTVDYYPLLPWFGVQLIGAGIGHLLYVRRSPRPVLAGRAWRMLGAPGRHSLAVYLLHQPLLLLALRGLLGPGPF